MVFTFALIFKLVAQARVLASVDDHVHVIDGVKPAYLLTGEKSMSEPLSGSGTAAALGGATVYGLFTGTDFGIVFGAFAGALFVATMPQTLSAWRVAAHFLVSFIVGVLGARVLSAWIAVKTGYDSTSADSLCAVLVSVVSVKILSFIHQQDIASLVSGLLTRHRNGRGGNAR